MMQHAVLIILAASAIGAAVESQGADRELPPGYQLVFQEDFSRPQSLARFVFSSPEHWRRVRVGDRYALEHTNAQDSYRPPFRSPHNIALVATHRFGSFVLECEVQQTGREYGHRDSCFFFNLVDPAHYYYTHIATHRDPHAHQVFIVNGAPRSAVTQQGTAGFEWGSSDQWHKVRIKRDAESGRIEVFVDDFQQPIMSAMDRTFPSGFIGFGSFDDTGRVTNIAVYSADFQEERPKFFAPHNPGGEGRRKQ